MDVLVRAVNAALFVSHGIRDDCHVILHLMGGGGPNRRIWFNGTRIGGVRPDERSIAGQIKGINKLPIPPRDRFKEFSSGILHSGGDINQTLQDWDERGVIPVLLDAEGREFNSIQHPNSLGFILSDDQPLSAQDKVSLYGLDSLSLGGMWLQGHSCISIIHHLLDQS